MITMRVGGAPFVAVECGEVSGLVIRVEKCAGPTGGERIVFERAGVALLKVRAYPIGKDGYALEVQPQPIDRAGEKVRSESIFDGTLLVTQRSE